MCPSSLTGICCQCDGGRTSDWSAVPASSAAGEVVTAAGVVGASVVAVPMGSAAGVAGAAVVTVVNSPVVGCAVVVLPT
ncbi:hypothetical protein RRF57_011276 [Xylaria bambusicola]|uniref:Uncharacterized protein n=1 Tax=Xylaria bambusicola TaxID=326684 RepID=A0AAN7V2H2_9PEZI